MNNLVGLTLAVLRDCRIECGANPYFDEIIIERRVKHEGDSFLTITLPAFCKDFERSLDQGFLSTALFARFRKAKKTRLPAFLRGFVERVFDSRGSLLEKPCHRSICAVRQICLLHKKILLPCTSARERAAEASFLQCEADVGRHDVSDSLWHSFVAVSGIIWSSVLGNVPFGDPYQELRPRHGPGTTQEGIRGNGKFLFPSWSTRLERSFPFTEFGIGSIRNFESGNDLPVSFVSPRNETPVRVVFVPKTLKTPRVIAIEPVCMQYTQQSISDWVRPRIESRCRYTSGHVNFRDQSVNARLAVSSSIDGRFATIDMSEASDRVSCLHVRDMLKCVPAFGRYVFDTRSTRATLPSGKSIHLRKFASMGSALCFPIESMVFYCAIIAIRLHNAGLRPTARRVMRFSRHVFVYGDDLIVPANEAPAICAGLETFGLKINTAKSFWTGKFRESCGMDAYDGTDVTPVYVRRLPPADRADVHAIASSVSLANQLYWKGLWGSAALVRRQVEKLLGKLPSVEDWSQRELDKLLADPKTYRGVSPGLGWVSFSQARSFNGWSERYQRLKCRSYVVSPVRGRDPLDGDAALLKCFGVIGSDTIDAEHLSTSVRYGNLALKRRWTLA